MVNLLSNSGGGAFGSSTFVQARSLFERTVSRGRVMRWLSPLLGRAVELLSFDDVEGNSGGNGYYDGLQTVPLSQVRGSVGRQRDFDSVFRPIQRHTQQRWIGIAMAEYEGRALPPVKLIQVDEVYFVVDGHHRISVARAMGRTDIEATVTVWAPQEQGAYMVRPSLALRGT